MKSREVYPISAWVLWVIALPAALLGLGVAAFAMTDVGTVPLDHPDLWWLFGVVPMVCAAFLWGLRFKRRAVASFASRALAPLLMDCLLPGRQAARAGLMVAAVGFVVAAIVGPRWGMYLEKQKVHGVDIVVALDVSKSMLANDLQPSRLERAKKEIRQQLVERPVFQGRHRMALMAFAGSTSIKVPLSTDLLAFRSKLEAVRVGSAPKGGTAIGNAVRSAADLFARSPEEATKIVLVFTDGEDHEGQPVEASREIREQHQIRVYTIGVGDASRTMGAEVPAGETSGGKTLLHDGQIVFSKLNVASLKEIAEAGGGRYAPVEDLHALVSAIAGMKSTELTTEERQRHKPRYQWFLAAALICLGFETTIRERRTLKSDRPERVWQLEAA